MDVTKTIEVAVEPGVPHDYDYIFTGESDEAPGIIAGDLYVRINIEAHAVYTRKGADLYVEKKITLLEALTGTYFTLEHLDGTKLVVATAPGDVISPNSTKTVKGKGMPFFKDAFAHGNLYVVFRVQFPEKKSITAEVSTKLKQALPGPKLKPLEKNAPNVEYLDDFHEQDTNPNPEGGRNRDEDDEDGHHGGAQRV